MPFQEPEGQCVRKGKIMSETENRRKEQGPGAGNLYESVSQKNVLTPKIKMR